MNWMLYRTNIKNCNCKLYQRGKMFHVNLTINRHIKITPLSTLNDVHIRTRTGRKHESRDKDDVLRWQDDRGFTQGLNLKFKVLPSDKHGTQKG